MAQPLWWPPHETRPAPPRRPRGGDGARHRLRQRRTAIRSSAKLKDETARRTVLGFPAFATKNTTRVGGEDAIADAAGVAHAVYPGEGTRRPALSRWSTRGDWQSGIAAAALMAPPLGAPILLTDGPDVPERPPRTRRDARADRLEGSRRRTGRLRIGKRRRPGRSARRPRSPPARPCGGSSIDRQVHDRGRGPALGERVIASADDPQYAMPAAAWAAKSGDAVLFVQRDAVPAATEQAIREHQQPGIYVLGPPSRSSRRRSQRALRKLGQVKRIAGADAGRVRDRVRPLLGRLVRLGRDRPRDTDWCSPTPAARRTPPPARPLSASGTYGPLLLLDSPTGSPLPVQDYLLDIQPGLPVRPGTRRLQSRLAHGRRIGDQPRDAGQDRLARGDRAGPPPGQVRLERLRVSGAARPGAPRHRR